MSSPRVEVSWKRVKNANSVKKSPSLKKKENATFGDCADPSGPDRVSSTTSVAIFFGATIIIFLASCFPPDFFFFHRYLRYLTQVSLGPGGAQVSSIEYRCQKRDTLGRS